MTVKNILNDIIAKSSRRWKAFPNLTLAGSYDFFTQTICLNTLEQRHIDELKNGHSYELVKKIFPLIGHEYTHWLDHLTTVWGQKSLLLIYNAINARLLNQENLLCNITDFHSFIRKTHYSNYYSVVYKTGKMAWDGRPWKMGITVGRQYGSDGRSRPDRPIVFVRFKTQDNMPVCRVPLTLLSLLETTATWAEMDTLIQATGIIDDNDVRTVERNLISQDFLKRLYNGELCVYSVCPHLLSHFTKITDVLLAYERSARLATICLNMPDILFQNIKVPQKLRFRFPDIEEYLRISKDRALAFYVMASQASRDPELDVETWISMVLTACKLPQTMVIDDMGNAQLENLLKQENVISGPESDRLHDIQAVGARLRASRGACGKLGFYEFFTREGGLADAPGFLLGDDQIMFVGERPPENSYSIVSIQDWILRTYDYTNSLDEFIEACIAE